MKERIEELAFPVIGAGVAAMGMTLRDYFAAKAMACLIQHNISAKAMAQASYDYADAMLEARKK